MHEEERNMWLTMDESSFAALSLRLSQSQRDRIIHQRRLKSAGLDTALASGGPANLKSLTAKLVSAQQREEHAAHAARDAVAYLGECCEEVQRLTRELEDAKAAAAAALAPVPVADPSARAKTIVSSLEGGLKDLLASLAKDLGVRAAQPRTSQLPRDSRASSRQLKWASRS